MAFVVKKRVSLEFLGEDWKDAYVVMTPFSWNDNTTLLKYRKADPETVLKDQEELSDIIKNRIVEGKGFDGTKLIPITKDNVGDLPMEAFMVIFTELQGKTLVPNS